MDDGLGVSGSLQVKELLREVHVDLPHPAGHALPHFLHALRQRLMLRVRKALGFDGVHLHYSVDSGLPQSRKARRRQQNRHAEQWKT